MEEVEKVARRLITVQAVYNLPVRDLMMGRLLGYKVEPLGVEDVYQIGAVAMRHSLYEEALPWLEAADGKLARDAHERGGEANGIYT